MHDGDKLTILRRKTIETLQKQSIYIIDTLPILEEGLKLRPFKEIISRMLVSYCLVAKASNKKLKQITIKWLENARLNEYLTQNEESFLYFDNGSERSYQVQEECLYSFAYILGVCEDINFNNLVPIEVAQKFPNIHITGSEKQFIEQLSLRDVNNVIGLLDLYYCLDWYCVDSMLKYQYCKIIPYVIKERRKVLEWALHPEFEWEQVPMDT